MHVQTAPAGGRKTVPTSEEYHVHMDARGGARAHIHMRIYYSVNLCNIMDIHCTCTRVHVHVSRRAKAGRVSSRASPRLIDCASACMCLLKFLMKKRKIGPCWPPTVIDFGHSFCVLGGWLVLAWAHMARGVQGWKFCLLFLLADFNERNISWFIGY